MAISGLKERIESVLSEAGMTAEHYDIYEEKIDATIEAVKEQICISFCNTWTFIAWCNQGDIDFFIVKLYAMGEDGETIDGPEHKYRFEDEDPATSFEKLTLLAAKDIAAAWGEAVEVQTV